MVLVIMVCVYFFVCLMVVLVVLFIGNLFKVLVVFFLLGMCLMLYLNCCMYNIYFLILVEGGFECGLSIVVSGLWLV